MATFNVFVEGPVDDSPMGLPELADAMSQRYGISAKELVTRLKRGRFRVKSNVDGESAERYRRDLISIGARVIIEDSALSPTATPVAGVPIKRAPILSLPPTIAEQAAAMPPTEEPRTFTIRGPQHPREPAPPSTPPPARPTPSPTARPTPTPTARPTPTPTSRPSTPPSGLSAAGPRASTPPPVRPSTPIPADMISGLSAAYGEESPQSDLGALGEIGALSLESLDGESAPAASNQFDARPEPEPELEKPSIKIKAKPKSETPRARPAAPSKAMDLFAPPDAGDQDLSVDLATEEVDDRARKQASAPPPPATPTPSSSRSQPMPVATPSRGEAEGGTAAYEKPFSREQFVIGIVLALAVGFIPAHFVARSRERAAFAVIDKQVEAAYASADSLETYQVLDTAREKFIDEKQSTRSMIGLTSMLLWAVISTGVAFAFFRFRKR